MPSSRTREYLEGAYARAHVTLHQGAWHLGSTLRRLLREDIPAAVRWLLPYIAWTTLLFVLAVCAGYALVSHYPDLIALVAGPELIASVERGKLWTEGLLNVVPSSVLSVQILTNNIVVSLFAYCAGFLFGLGTLYIIGLNGFMLGAVFAFVGQHGLARQLFSFIVAHGCVELSVMCLSGAAGAAVGEALIRPGAAGRRESFRAAALRSGVVLVACALLLVGAGLIEGFISPNPHVPLGARVAIGVGYWLAMLVLLSGLPRRRCGCAGSDAARLAQCFVATDQRRRKLLRRRGHHRRAEALQQLALGGAAAQLLRGGECDPRILPVAGLGRGQRLDLATVHAGDQHQVRRRQQTHRARQRAGHAGVVEVGEHDDQGALTQQPADAHGGRGRIGFRRAARPAARARVAVRSPPPGRAPEHGWRAPGRRRPAARCGRH